MKLNCIRCGSHELKKLDVKYRHKNLGFFRLMCCNCGYESGLFANSVKLGQISQKIYEYSCKKVKKNEE